MEFLQLCILTMLQSFGLIFRDRFAELGINSSQTTTIININFAVTSCTGKLFSNYASSVLIFRLHAS